MNLNDKDYIEELFSKSLSEHQTAVRPELWNAIQTKMVANSTVATTSVAGTSLLTKGIISLVAASVISVGTYLLVIKEQAKPVSQEKTAPTSSQPTIKKDEKEAEQLVVSSVKENTQKENTAKLKPVELGRKEQVATVPVAHSDSPLILTERYKETEEPISITGSSSTALSEQNKKVIQKEVKQAQPFELAKEEVVKQTTTSYVKPWSKTNVFTPNGDGINDYFFLQTGDLKEFSISILDMNNNVVYVSQNPNFQWDGTNLSGEKVPDGNYSYIIYAVGSSGEQIKQFNLLYITK